MSTPARPPVVSKAEWIAARRSLLELEKVATRLTDAVNAARRRLPMVRVDSSYVFRRTGRQAHAHRPLRGAVTAVRASFHVDRLP